MSLIALLQTGCLLALVLLLMAAAWQDLRTMRIANAFSLAIAGSFLVWSVASLALERLAPHDLALNAACALGVFALGAVGFAAGMLGGGDVKLLAATSLFAGPALLTDFLLVTAVVGGALGLAVLAGAQIGPASAAGTVELRVRLRGGLPYGPAIAAGGLWVAAVLAVG